MNPTRIALHSPYLINKGFSGVVVNVLFISKNATEHEGFVHCGGGRVGVKLLHIPRDSSKAVLLFGMAINAHISLDPAPYRRHSQTCSAEHITSKAFLFFGVATDAYIPLNPAPYRRHNQNTMDQLRIP